MRRPVSLSLAFHQPRVGLWFRFLSGALIALLSILLPSLRGSQARGCLIRIVSPYELDALRERADALRVEVEAHPTDPRRIEELLRLETRLAESVSPDRGDNQALTREDLTALAESWRELEPENLEATVAVMRLQAVASDAEATLRAFVDRYPDRGDGISELAALLQYQGREQEAQGLVDGFLALNGDDPEAYRAALRLAEIRGDAAADALAHTLMERFPDHPLGLKLRFATLQRDSKAPLDDLRTVVEQLLAVEEDLEEDLLGQMCRTLQDRSPGGEDLALVEDCYHRLIERAAYPGDMEWARGRLARALLLRGDGVAAEMAFFGDQLPIEAEPRLRLEFARLLVGVKDCRGALGLAETLERGLFRETSAVFWDCGLQRRAADDLRGYYENLPLEEWEWQNVHRIVPPDLLQVAGLESLLQEHLRADPDDQTTHETLENLQARLAEIAARPTAAGP